MTSHSGQHRDHRFVAADVDFEIVERGNGESLLELAVASAVEEGLDPGLLDPDQPR